MWEAQRSQRLKCTPTGSLGMLLLWLGAARLACQKSCGRVSRQMGTPPGFEAHLIPASNGTSMFPSAHWTRTSATAKSVTSVAGPAFRNATCSFPEAGAKINGVQHLTSRTHSKWPKPCGADVENRTSHAHQCLVGLLLSILADGFSKVLVAE